MEASRFQRESAALFGCRCSSGLYLGPSGILCGAIHAAAWLSLRDLAEVIQGDCRCSRRSRSFQQLADLQRAPWLQWLAGRLLSHGEQHKVKLLRCHTRDVRRHRKRRGLRGAERLGLQRQPGRQPRHLLDEVPGGAHVPGLDMDQRCRAWRSLPWTVLVEGRPAHKQGEEGRLCVWHASQGQGVFLSAAGSRICAGGCGQCLP
mmetsp:Transcript_103713/g.263391  ORF Transcript_103713/g.263391 Transcript_103713/m.263391 type:complete len:204 (+) Transcript_103713:529-1140(+)